MQIYRLVLLAVAFAATFTLCRAQGQASTSGRQLTYPLGWEDLVSAWRQLEEAEYNETGAYIATVEAKLKQLGGVIKQGTTKWTIRTKPRFKHMSSTTEIGEESVFARTPDYAFAVKRRPQEPEWKLIYLSKDSSSDDTHRFEESLPGGFSLSVLYPLGTVLENERCSKYFDEENRKNHLKELNFIDGEKPRLEWTYDWPCQANLTMDAPPNYITRQFESIRTDVKSLPRRTTFVRELVADGKRPSSPLPLCKSVSYKLLVDKEGGETLNDVRITFSDYSFDPPPDDIFRFSHYGLPESLATSGATSKIWLWLLLSAAGCLTIAILFRYLNRRKAQLRSTGENR